ncbi:hypothetical protein ACKWTF_001249 [Chironomus riparius]
MENFLNEPIFDMLRETNPAVLRKIIPIEVDYNAYDLNIDPQTLDRLHGEVQIVFNVVASVKFNESLNDAIQINFLGTKKIVKLALGIEKLKSFVHVSTLYSNCNRQDIDEKIYNHILSYNELIPVAKVIQHLKDDVNAEQFLFQNLPNTYTLTKHFAEKLVYHQTFFMPSGIFRPGVVISNYKDFPGYTDNVNGPTGVVVWTVRGYIHCIYGDVTKRANLMPVDYCINALIATAWDIHENYQERLRTCSNIPIYNHMFNENNLKWKELMDLVPLGFHEPLQKSIWYYSYFIVSSKIMFKILNFTYHTIPAFIMDILAFMIGKKMIYRRAYAKTEKILIIMSFFGLREWNFGNRNIQMLLEKTKKFSYQRGSFDFDMRKINWTEYFRNFIPGIKRYYFKENAGSVKRIAAYYHWLKRIHVTFKYLAYFLCSRKILNILLAILGRNFVKYCVK